MKKICALAATIGLVMLCSNAFAGGGAPDFVGTWTGEYCTMNSKEGLGCGKPMEIVIDERKNDLVRGRIIIKGKDYPLSGVINADKMIDYTDALNSIGVLRLKAGKTLQMKAVNRCVADNAVCAHSGTFKRKK